MSALEGREQALSIQIAIVAMGDDTRSCGREAFAINSITRRNVGIFAV